MDIIIKNLPFGFFLGATVYCIAVGSKRSREEEKAPEEVIDHKAALRFPIMGSGVLLGLYIMVKYVSKEYLNLLLAVYFCVLGSFGVNQYVREFTGHNFATGIGSIILSCVHFYTNNWITNNIMGIAFSVSAIHLVPINSVKVGVMLLSLLFFYDIFWVFGTDVMITVAKSIDVPVKILFPKDIRDETFKFSLLGLGDIVLPGFFIALMRRMDKEFKNKNEDYYKCGLGCYMLGLINTFVVMMIFKAGQPALLYLVPWTVGGTFLLSAKRGEISKWFFFEEENRKKDEEEYEELSYTDCAYNIGSELFGYKKREANKKSKKN